MALLKQSTAYNRSFLLVASSDHLTGATGKTPSVSLSKSSGTFSAAAGSVSEIANGWYKIALTTTDTNTLGDLSFSITASGCDPTDFCDQVIAADLTNGTTLGLSALPSAAAGSTGGLPTVDSTNSVKIQTPVKRNTALNNFSFGMIDASNNPLTGLVVTSQVSIDGGSMVSTVNNPTEVSNGNYKINLAAADLNGTVILLRLSASGAVDNDIVLLTLP